MTASPSLVWSTRLGSFFIWLLVGFSLVFWFLRGVGSNSQIGNQVPVISHQSHINPESMLRALGGNQQDTENPETTTTDALAQRIRLMGVLAFSNGAGAALLSIDQEIADPYKIGEEVIEGWKLQSISARRITLVAQSNPSQTSIIDLPEPSTTDGGEIDENDAANNTASTLRKNMLRNSMRALPNGATNANIPNQFNPNQNTNLPNAGNGIDPNAPNPVINANPNRIPANPNPDAIVVTPQ